MARRYGAFSYNHSQVDVVYKYIKNQEKHHAKTTFRTEFVSTLDKFNIPYEERYIFEELK